MEKFWNWLGKSSENPEKVAMTVKGILTANIGIIALIVFSGDTDKAMTVIDQITILISTAITLVGAVQTTFGLIRKIYNTVTVENK